MKTKVFAMKTIKQSQENMPFFNNIQLWKINTYNFHIAIALQLAIV